MELSSSLRGSPLFAGLSDAEIESCLRCGRAGVASYEKDELIFRQGETPQWLLVLLEGSVVVGQDSGDGRRSVAAAFDRPGELFGEVFVFLHRAEYQHYAQAASRAKILRIPREFLFHTCGENCGHHERLISNMLSILAGKAYFLNQRLQILSCATLRQKLARVLLMSGAPGGKPACGMSREELADFLNAARPSVSRELMRMQDDGLIALRGREIFVPDRSALEELL
jgi:cAMP-binding proteins - catabolite gene activator and regulatory subunit of cAMP-dependent protein kinases